MKKLFLIISVLVATTNIYSQPEDWDEYINWAWSGKFSPFMKANIGYGFPGYNSISGQFSSIGIADLELGYTEYKQYSDFVFRLDDRYLFGSYFTSDAAVFGNNEPRDVDTQGWRVGIGHNIGYGYKVWAFSFFRNTSFFVNDRLLGGASLHPQLIIVLFGPSKSDTPFKLQASALIEDKKAE